MWFNDPEIDHIKKYCGEHTQEIDRIIDTIVQGNTSVKMSYDQYHDFYYFTLQPRDKRNPYYGYTLGFGHLDLVRGVQVCNYIATELMPAEAIPFPENRSIQDI